MKKKKQKVVYDQDYLDCLKIFQEEYYYGIPDVEIEESEEEKPSNDETVWVIVMKRFYDHECRETKLYSAFKSEAEARCHLRWMKHEMSDSFKCYGGKRHFTAYLRNNKKIQYRYYIDDVDYY